MRRLQNYMLRAQVVMATWESPPSCPVSAQVIISASIIYTVLLKEGFAVSYFESVQ